MNRASSAAIRSALFFFASSILCAGAQAGTQSPPEDAGEAQAHAVELIELMELMELVQTGPTRLSRPTSQGGKTACRPHRR
ncbi:MULTISPECIES: hypothetical protein [unclassified Janthinobacterium]|uniref:hypothetical protein n=1 Tax=unclassified Janthinobacterium TaxID=2610881 RepID=UPI0024741157|nr:hypothetical protein [Janthinobacterium sp. CG_23.4]MDH6157562.1 hypothetical protein [Janthinobacterium sp. CG_23.4]